MLEIDFLLRDTQRDISATVLQLTNVKKDIKECKSKLDLLTNKLKLTKIALNILAQQKENIEKFVSQGIGFIYPGWSIEVVEVSTDKTLGYKIIYICNGIKYDDPLTAGGSGIYVCTDILFRIGIIYYSKTSNVLICDEPVPEIDVNAFQKLIQWVDNFSKNTGFIITLTTHNPSASGKIFNMSRTEDGTHTVEVYEKG